jgi:hypothetical protein
MSKVSDLPIPESGCGNSRFTSDGLAALLEYEFRSKGRDRVAGIQFDGVVAHRFRNEMHSRGYSSEAYESVAEINPSTWKQELSSLEPGGIADMQKKHHFAVFLSSNGYFEVLAESFSLVEPREGKLA